MSLNIAVGGDHAGYELKKTIVELLKKRGYTVKDFGPHSEDSVDYPDFVHPVATGIHSGQYDFGVVICGSGNGVCMTANKHADIRAALCWQPELASLARQHNNANVLCMPARYISEEKGIAITKAFFDAEFEGGRHQRRVDKINL
ncbi:Ribose 5-phosphate isomerase B [hydrothermal vent metagenome]|uniref:Ribose 5-phosphate isomerase B n=1 Tax=hydrothermal vent metagenome TaxID=652676 RepID=A0A3B0V339_9ZZZZ